MTDRLYTDEDVQAVIDQLYSFLHDPRQDREHAEAILDAVAPAIAARALREAANDFGPAQLTGIFKTREGYMKSWLLVRADKIEAGR